MERLIFGESEYIGVIGSKDSCIGCDLFGADASCYLEAHDNLDQRCESKNIIWKVASALDEDDNMSKYTLVILEDDEFLGLNPVLKRLETNNIDEATKHITGVFYVLEGWPKEKNNNISETIIFRYNFQ